MDKFSQNAAILRGEILVAKFIASSQGTLVSKLRLRRSTTLNECVQIANSLAATAPSSSSCMLVSPPDKQGKIKLKTNRKVSAMDSTKICFCCGSTKHIASAPDCPARNSECEHCHKVGHWRKVCKSFQSLGSTDNVRISSITFAASRGQLFQFCLSNSHSADVIVDTGAEVSFLNVRDFSVFSSKTGTQLQSVNQTFHNFDGTHIWVQGCIPKVGTTFNNKSAFCTFYIADVPHSIIVGVTA